MKIKPGVLRTSAAYTLAFGHLVVGLAYALFLLIWYPQHWVFACFFGPLLLVVGFGARKNLLERARRWAVPGQDLQEETPAEPKKPEIETPPYLLLPWEGMGENAWHAEGWGSRIIPDYGMPCGIRLGTKNREDLIQLLRKVADAMEKAEVRGASIVGVDFPFYLKLLGPRTGWERHPELRDEHEIKRLARELAEEDKDHG